MNEKRVRGEQLGPLFRFVNGLRDGLYRIDSGSFCAGLEIERGRVVAIAPALRKILPFIVRQAKWIAPSLRERRVLQARLR